MLLHLKFLLSVFRVAYLTYCSTLTGVPMQAINRPGSQLLGANGRDDGPVVSFYPMNTRFF